MLKFEKNAIWERIQGCDRMAKRAILLGCTQDHTVTEIADFLVYQTIAPYVSAGDDVPLVAMKHGVWNVIGEMF